MADTLEHVLRLVAEGRLTAAQAAPILDALAATDTDEPSDVPGGGPVGSGETTERQTATAIRIEITEDGRKVVNLRIPVSLGRLALDRIPGLSGSHAELVRRALADGRSGTLLQIDEDDGGVRIALE
jgi:hypothetical protein